MKDRNILIIGGGRVGESRAKKFFFGGAKVTVLGLDFTEELKRLNEEGKIRLITADASNLKLLEDLVSKNDLIVVALNTDELNDVIIDLSKRFNKLVNLTNDADRTEVVVPFEAKVGDLRVAATSEGKSGIVVREALRRMIKAISEDKEIFTLLQLMYYLKRYMKELKVPIETRMKLYYRAFDDPTFRELAREGRVGEARKRIEKIVKSEVK